MKLNKKETDAILAGLRFLQKALELGNVKPNDGDVGDILTDSGTHEGLNEEEIDDLIDKLQDE